MTMINTGSSQILKTLSSEQEINHALSQCHKLLSSHSESEMQRKPDPGGCGDVGHTVVKSSREYQTQIAKLTQDNVSLRSKVICLKSQLDAIKSVLYAKECDYSVQTKRAKEEEKRQQQKISNMTGIINSLTREKATLKEKIKDLQKKGEQLIEAVALLTEERKSFKTKCKELKEIIKEYKSEFGITKSLTKLLGLSENKESYDKSCQASEKEYESKDLIEDPLISDLFFMKFPTSFENLENFFELQRNILP